MLSFPFDQLRYPKKYLTAYWISFPQDTYSPLGITAYSVEDAYKLLDLKSIYHHLKAKQVVITENIQWDNIPSPEHVHPNMGPMAVRGIWYPNLNSN